jgi:hypothetical protein
MPDRAVSTMIPMNLDNITFRWLSRETKQGVYIIEYQDGKHGFIEYGPMTKSMIQEFIDSRKRYIQKTIDDAKDQIIKNKFGM